MSQRDINAPHNPPAADPQVATIRTIQIGTEWANQLAKELQGSFCADWDQRKMVVAALVYASAMASETGMSEDAWIDLSVMAFRGVSVT